MVLNSFIKENLWDEARIFYGDKEFMEGVRAPEINAIELDHENLGYSKLAFIKNKTIFSQ